MKKIFKYLGILLAIALMGVVNSCNRIDPNQEADLGLSIKVYAPTRVVAGQPMTINGTKLSEVTEIVFPGDVVVSTFETVSDGMIRVVAPAGIAAEGGIIKVRSASEEAESKVALSLGKTTVSGFSKQEGESIQGGENFTVYGSDLEFITSVELLDEDGQPLIIEDPYFYRKGTSNLVFTIPQNIFTGNFVGKMNTYDGRILNLPDMHYEPAPTGHWEIIKEVIWKNDGSKGEISWSGDYRFGLEGNDGNNECIATFPAEIWNKIKTGTFYVTLQGANPQIRVTTGWWSTTWTGQDIQPGNELLVNNEDGSFTLTVTLAGDPILDLIDQQHLLFTGGGYTPIEIYFQEEKWVENGSGPSEVVFWENDGSKGEISWSGDYRFGLDGNDGNNECIATFSAEIWDKIKSGTFYLTLQGANPQIRVTTGWWSTTWTGQDIQPGNELLKDNEDGTFTLTINLEGDPILDSIDQQHLLFTGGGYTPLKLFFIE